MLTGQPKAALEHAVSTAIRSLEWLPTPAELLRIAEAYTAPERLAHAIAIRIARDHRNGQLEATLRQCREGELTESELQALPDPIAKIAETRGHILIWRDGKRTYRNRETLAAMLAHLDDWGDAIAHERSKRASDGDIPGEFGASGPEMERGGTGGPETAQGAPRASLGEFAASLMAGVEVSDAD